MSSESSVIGKWFEDKLHPALKSIQSKQKAMCHRFPDTRAARNPLPAQPGDFLLNMAGMAILIEAKCSSVHDNLTSGFSSLWPKGEAAFHRLWHRSGQPSWVIFCHYDTEIVHIWAGEDIAYARATGQKLPRSLRPLVTGTVDTLELCLLKAVVLQKEIWWKALTS